MSHGNVSWKYVFAHPVPNGQEFCLEEGLPGSDSVGAILGGTNTP